jgi:predicted membrane protein (TIGR00267 family)
MLKKTLRHEIVDSMREIVFGLEDSLVSTLGAITGIAVGTKSQYIVILSGIVILAAEAMSMAAGSYLSSKRAFEAEATYHHSDSADPIVEQPRPLRAGLVMGACYVVGGLVPLAFYFFLPVATAILPAIILSAAALFLVGYWAAGFTKTSKWKSGIEMTAISLAAALLGYLVGFGVSAFFGVDVVL